MNAIICLFILIAIWGSSCAQIKKSKTYQTGKQEVREELDKGKKKLKKELKRWLN